MNIVIINKLKDHIATSFLIVFFLIVYMYNNTWVDDALPLNGKPMAAVTLIAISLVYEILKVAIEKKREEILKKVSGLTVNDTELTEQIHELSRVVQVGHLTNSVNSMYFRFVASGDENITNEYTIKEIGQLMDTRKKLGVNSFVEGRLGFLAKHIRSD